MTVYCLSDATKRITVYKHGCKSAADGDRADQIVLQNWQHSKQKLVQHTFSSVGRQLITLFLAAQQTNKTKPIYVSTL